LGKNNKLNADDDIQRRSYLTFSILKGISIKNGTLSIATWLGKGCQGINALTKLVKILHAEDRQPTTILQE